MATLPANRSAPRPTPEPAKAVLALRRLTNREIALRLGLSELVVGRYLNGWVPASARFRAGLSELLGEPESAPFRGGKR